MRTRYRVALVFDEFGAQRISKLAEHCHVWAIESDDNERAARRIWDGQNSDSNGITMDRGVTLFSPIGASVVDSLRAMIELIEEHHGAYAHDPPVNELIVSGLSLTDDVKSILRQWGYESIGARDGCFVAARHTGSRREGPRHKDSE